MSPKFWLGFLASCYGDECGERLGPTQLGVGVLYALFTLLYTASSDSNPAPLSAL